MGSLAIDIETASPFKEPQQEDFRNTDYFELVAVALGYRSSPDGEIETSVLFREGGWETESTATLLEQVIEWCGGKEIDRTLTYNGSGFDAIHLRNWASDVDEDGLGSDTREQIDRLFSNHVDLSVPAGERYADQLDYRDFPKFEDACSWEDLETTPTYYSDYDIDKGILENSEIDDNQVEGWHIGTTWGERYVQWIEAGLQEQKSFIELQRLIEDYATADVRPLYELHTALSQEA